jgi:hypothetical protein
MTQSQLLEACKLACRISSTTLDDEFNELIASAYYDLEISGVADINGVPYDVENSDELVITAVKTYVKLHLGDLLDDASARRLEESYWFQVAKLKMRNHSDAGSGGGDDNNFVRHSEMHTISDEEIEQYWDEAHLPEGD